MHLTWQSSLFYVSLILLLTSSIILTSIVVRSFQVNIAYSVTGLTFLALTWLTLIISILVETRNRIYHYVISGILLTLLLVAVVMEWLIIPFNEMSSELYKYSISSSVLSLTALIIGIIGIGLWLRYFNNSRKKSVAEIVRKAAGR